MLTVSQLIEELQRMPQHLPVHVTLSEVTIAYEDSEDTFQLGTHDAQPADRVRHEGAFVLISP